MPMDGRGLHSKGLTEDTLSVLRDGGNNGNEISENTTLRMILLQDFNISQKLKDTIKS